jgi:hypothetical protein
MGQWKTLQNAKAGERIEFRKDASTDLNRFELLIFKVDPPDSVPHTATTAPSRWESRSKPEHQLPVVALTLVSRLCVDEYMPVQQCRLMMVAPSMHIVVFVPFLPHHNY